MKRRRGGQLRLVLTLLAAAVAAVILLPILGGVVLGMALSEGAQRTIYQRIVSPDGQLEARVQFDDCGAACSFDRIVLIKPRWLNDEPLLSCRAFLADGEAPVHLSWTGPRQLLIRHSFRPEDVRAKANHCGGVQVRIDAG